jgi:hypothetical protein
MTKPTIPERAELVSWARLCGFTWAFFLRNGVLVVSMLACGWHANAASPAGGQANNNSATTSLHITANVVPGVLSSTPQSNIVNDSVTYNLTADRTDIEVTKQTKPFRISTTPNKGRAANAVLTTTTVVLR